MKWLDAVRTRLRLLFARRSAESRMNAEFRLHIDLETERLVREQGLTPGDARRRALVAFGAVESHKETLRDGRGLAWLGGLALDFKLGARMLARYPALTLVGGAAIAFGIAAGVGAFELQKQFVNPSLPLDEGSRIVGLRHWDASVNRAVPSTLDDFDTWRDALTHVEDVSAFRSGYVNLITEDGRAEAEALAQITASAFRVTRVPPLLGRTLVESDDAPGAPPVGVIGHALWTRRFGGDPAVVGRAARLGSEQVTIVGVMPEGFAFPAAHALWVPLTRTAASPAADQDLMVFGRLARNASRSQAQAELNAVGSGKAGASRATSDDVRPQLIPFTRLMFEPGEIRIGLALGNAFVLVLLLLVSANVALLMFARAATRETEIAVRSALGAGRSRIVAQLFVEALVLAAVAVAIGLAAVRFGLESIEGMFEANSGRALPFWMGADLTPTTVVYAGALAVISAAIIGILPALKLTGRGHQARLRQSTAGGGVRFSGVWTVVIVAQVAATVMFPAFAFVLHRSVVASQTRDLGFPADQYLSARLETDRVRGAALTYDELERRMSAEPAVTGMTFVDRFPGAGHPLERIEIDEEGQGRAAAASVALNYFDVLGAPILAGRGFTAADLDSALGVAIVNQSFVTRVLGGRNPLGRRIRLGPSGSTDAQGPWLEIIGVVRDLGMVSGAEGAGFYQPVSADRARTLRVMIGVRGNPQAFAARFRAVAAQVEPTLQIHELMPLRDAGASGWLEFQYLSRVMAVLSAIALLLSLTAIYSVTAYTVSKRTREIGIRIALGADRRRVVGPILQRPLTQVSFGVIAGAPLAVGLLAGISERAPSRGEIALIGVYTIMMMGICLLACVVPAQRALRAQPADVLRADA